MMFHSKQPMKISYPMAAPPGGPSTKSRGHSLFERQAQLNAPDCSNNPNAIIDTTSSPTSPLKSIHSISPKSHHHHQAYSPSAMPRRLPVIPAEPYSHSNNDNVQLLSVHPRPELTYIKETPPPSFQPKIGEKLLETDFPLIESPLEEDQEQISTSHSIPSDTTCVAMVEQAFDYLQPHDDDEDVIHQSNDDDEQQYHSNSFDDEEDESVDSTMINHSQAHDSGVQTGSSLAIHEKLTDQSSNMACSSRGTISEDYDSDFENSSHEDEEHLNRKDSINEQEEHEQQVQFILEQKKQFLWGIVQEWSKKEESYQAQLKLMQDQLQQIPNSNPLLDIIRTLANFHSTVNLMIDDLYDAGRDLPTLVRQMAKVIERLIMTLPLYENYIKVNLAPFRKALDKRLNAKESSSEDLLSIPPKQFLQILSQVQDLYQTAQSFETDDELTMNKLYGFAQKCKDARTEQDDKINKIILKTEDVGIMTQRKTRDRCRLILYSDAIVICNWRSKLLASPKYVLLGYIPIAELVWNVPQDDSDDKLETGDELKRDLKTAYKEWEKNPKTSSTTSSRLSKNIRKQESEYNLAHSNLQLVLSSTSKDSIKWTLLFSSNYQRQDWIDFIEKTKLDLPQRPTTNSNQPQTHPQPHRLNESLIQKRLDLVKPSCNDSISTDSPSTLRSSPQNTQTKLPSKTYSGTLQITIHSIYGPALTNPVRQNQTLPLMSSVQQQASKNYQYYVAIENDSYNTFYPCAQTNKQTMQQQDCVEFRRAEFEVELEYSSAFRLLIHRVDTTISGQNNSLDRIACIGKFHRDIETALADCKRGSTGILVIESRSGDLRVKLSLKHSRRDGTFKRQASKRSQAVFGKSIQNIVQNSSAHENGIPKIVIQCVRMVERDGLTETGIYRVCCVTSDLQKLRHQFDRDYRRGEILLEDKNVHVAANLLKLFFRELPEPLFTTALYPQFLSAIQLTDSSNRLVSLLRTLNNLPSEHKTVLFYLLDHLIRVSDHSDKNMMHLDNLAVVFGPTLMRPSKLIDTTYYANNSSRSNPSSTHNGYASQAELDPMSSELQGSMYQCQVVLACLKLRKEGEFK